MGLRAWRLGWVLGCLGVSLLLLSGCDTGREADSRLSRVQVVLHGPLPAGHHGLSTLRPRRRRVSSSIRSALITF